MKTLLIGFSILFMLMMGCSTYSTNVSPAEMRNAVAVWSDEELKRAYWEWLGALRQAERNATTSSNSTASGGIIGIFGSFLDSASTNSNINNINQIDSGLMIIRSEMSVRNIYP